MSISNRKESGCRSLSIDRETWSAVLEPALCNAPKTAESLAHLLFAIKAAIESGADGIKEAGETLLDGIEMAYLYTDAHKTAFKLYLLSLTGRIKPQDEPVQLIGEAIKRGAVEITRASVVGRTKVRR